MHLCKHLCQSSDFIRRAFVPCISGTPCQLVGNYVFNCSPEVRGDPFLKVQVDRNNENQGAQFKLRCCWSLTDCRQFNELRNFLTKFLSLFWRIHKRQKVNRSCQIRKRNLFHYRVYERDKRYYCLRYVIPFTIFVLWLKLRNLLFNERINNSNLAFNDLVIIKHFSNYFKQVPFHICR